jgi:hypothetical protein
LHFTWSFLFLENTDNFYSLPFLFLLPEQHRLRRAFHCFLLRTPRKQWIFQSTWEAWRRFTSTCELLAALNSLGLGMQITPNVYSAEESLWGGDFNLCPSCSFQ